MIRGPSAAAKDEQDGAMTRSIKEMFPGCPAAEATRIAVHTAVRGSGRIGRSAAGRALEGEALRLAVRAAIRHRHTRYDQLLAAGVDRGSARHEASDKVEEDLRAWQARSISRASP